MYGQQETVGDLECLLDEIDLMRRARLIDDAEARKWNERIIGFVREQRGGVIDELQSLLATRGESDRVPCSVDTPRELQSTIDAYVDLSRAGIYLMCQNAFIAQLQELAHVSEEEVQNMIGTYRLYLHRNVPDQKTNDAWDASWLDAYGIRIGATSSDGTTRWFDYWERTPSECKSES